MKLFRSLAAVAMLAAAVALAAAVTVRDHVVAFTIVAASGARDWIGDLVADAARAGAILAPPPLVAFVRAQAFHLRQVKRERPKLTGAWRMCPST